MASNRKKSALQKNFPFIPGDVVELSSRQHEHGFSEIKITQGNRITLLKSGETKMSSPVMVVIEVVREDEKTSHQHGEKTGGRSKNTYKVCCQWFSHQTGQFHERWLNAILLHKIEFDNKTLQFKSKINEVVTLRTALFANRQTSEELSLALSPDDNSDKSDFQITRSFNTLGFLPPKMVVLGSSKRKQMPPLIDKGTGKPKRLLSEYQIKCMWYDYRTGKLSELDLSPDALMLVSDLPNEHEIIKKALLSKKAVSPT